MVGKIITFLAHQIHFCLPLNTPLTIIAASGRQLAQIAGKAGLQLVVVDSFLDRDTRHISALNRIEESPKKDLATSTCNLKLLPRNNEPIVLDNQPTGLIVGGGYESRLPQFEKLCQSKNILFCGTSASCVRDLFQHNKINACLDRLGINFEPFLSRSEMEKSIGERGFQFDHVCKRLQSAGGQSVHRCNSDEDFSKYKNTDKIYQKIIRGKPISGLFCASPIRIEQATPDLTAKHIKEKRLDLHARPVRTLGVTEQLIGEAFCSASPFQYCGSISGLAIASKEENQIQEIAQGIANEFGLRGVFGIDFIQNEKGVWPVDINPRFTASSEIVQRAELEGENLILTHLESFDLPEFKLAQTQHVENSQTKKRDREYGKAILFNGLDDTIAFPESIMDYLPMSYCVDDRESSIADVPMPGTCISSGHPILTVLASGQNSLEVRRKLENHANTIYEKFSNQ